MEWQAEQAYNHLPPLPLDSALAELAETLTHTQSLHSCPRRPLQS